MSETDKPAEVEATSATNGIGLPEDTGIGAVTEKSYENENGLSTAAAVEEEQKHEKKEEDVEMVEAAGVNGSKEKESKEVRVLEEREPMKVEVEENETEERELMEVEVEEKVTKDYNAAQETEEKGEEAEEKVKEADEKGEQAAEKGEGAEEKGEEAEEKGEEAEENREMGEEIEDKGGEVKGVQAEEHEDEKGTREKRRRGRKPRGKGEMKEKETGKAKDVFRIPLASSVERPVRERKTVERLVESLEKQPAKGFLIEKGQGTPLKDIPNVAYKLAKRKPDDIRLLHLLLFGRKGKAINFKSHIFQFSGFVWHDNEGKQRAKVKEKLDKCIKDKLLDLCDVFDIPGSRATSRKEDLVAKLLDFMVSPHATTNVILAEKEQSTKSRKRKRVSRGSDLRRRVGTPARRSRKKRTKNESALKSEKSENDTEDEDEDGGEEDNVNSPPDEDVEMKHSEDEKSNESEHENDADEEEYSGKWGEDRKKSSKLQGSSGMPKSKKVSTPMKPPPLRSTNSPAKASLKRFKANEDKYENKKVSSREKRDDGIPKKRMSSSKDNLKEKRTAGKIKKAGRPKAKSHLAEESGPTNEELRNTICEILKEVDFNTATFTDILKKLASHYNTDLTARKTSIKLMIQGELTKLAEEAEDEDDDDDEGAEDKLPESTGKEIEA